MNATDVYKTRILLQSFAKEFKIKNPSDWTKYTVKSLQKHLNTTLKGKNLYSILTSVFPGNFVVKSIK